MADANIKQEVEGARRYIEKLKVKVVDRWQEQRSRREGGWWESGSDCQVGCCLRDLGPVPDHTNHVAAEGERGRSSKRSKD